MLALALKVRGAKSFTASTCSQDAINEPNTTLFTTTLNCPMSVGYHLK